jgi:hypothetical protein
MRFLNNENHSSAESIWGLCAFSSLFAGGDTNCVAACHLIGSAQYCLLLLDIEMQAGSNEGILKKQAARAYVHSSI